MSPKIKQRNIEDRRLDELGPPHGWKDRRRHTERRLPEIAEFLATESQWQMYFCRADSEAPINNEPSEDVFARIRE